MEVCSRGHTPPACLVHYRKHGNGRRSAMKVAVAGGTGVVGRLTVEAVRGNGDEPVVLARSTGVELVSGHGLAQALAGAGAVIDVSNIAATRASVVSEFFEATSRNLMRAAAQAGIRHIVALS